MELDNILQDFRSPFSSRKYYGTGRISEIMNQLGNPQDSYFSVHVAGTNGKGSVCSMLHSVFVSLGYKTGLFTSPHLERFTERIKINSDEIKEEDFLRILNDKVLPAVNKVDQNVFGKPTEFEVLTAVSFCYFEEQKVDLVVFEAGLGGKSDATNILSRVIFSVITSISLDHTDRLGNTTEEITKEKTGIIKPGVPVITSINNKHHEIFREKTDLIYFAEPEAIEIEEVYIEPVNNNISFLKSGYFIKSSKKNSIFYEQKLFVPLLGKHQLENISIVLKSLEILFETKKLINIDREVFIEKVKNGLSESKWNGRFELINYHGLLITLDGAHNEGGMINLCENIKKYFNNKEIITIFACNKDKEFQKMLDLLIKVTDYFILTQSHVSVKAKSLEDLSDYLTKSNKDHKIVKDYSHTIDFVSRILSERNIDKEKVLVNICGSLYLIGVIRALFYSELKNNIL